MRCLLVAAVALPLLVCSPADVSAEPPRLDEPAQALEAFLRTRASSDPEQEVIFHWSGSIHELLPGASQASRQPLLRFEGFNVVRAVPLEEGGWRLLSREITLYQDPDGQRIDCWKDPAAPADEAPRAVLHTRNDPVNFDLGAPSHRVVDDRVVWSLALPLNYASPLPVADYPQNSAGDRYQSVELFDFEVSLDALADASSPSIPARVTWSRVGQWLPWMGRGQQPGWLVYHANGQKIGSWGQLPESLRSWVLEHAPAYQHAPEQDLSPNQTSWTVFRQAASAGELPGVCEPGG